MINLKQLTVFSTIYQVRHSILSNHATFNSFRSCEPVSLRSWYTYVVHVEGLVGDGQIAMGRGLAAPVIHLLANGQLLLMVFDGLQKGAYSQS